MNSKTYIRAVVISVLVMSGCANQALKPDKESAYTSDYSITITTITEKGGRVDWSHTVDLIVFDRKGEDGFYDVSVLGNVQSSCTLFLKIVKEEK